jgi:hypothetical protein
MAVQNCLQSLFRLRLWQKGFLCCPNQLLSSSSSLLADVQAEVPLVSYVKVRKRQGFDSPVCIVPRFWHNRMLCLVPEARDILHLFANRVVESRVGKTL